MQATRLARASKVIIWNRWFLSVLGLWPRKVNQPLFVLFSTYIITHCVMGANHLIKHSNQADYIIANLTENVLFFMILGKMFICRRSCGTMADFLRTIDDDFTASVYIDGNEITAYLYYNEIALMFVKISMSMTVFTASVYYCKTFLVNWSALASGNFSYELPYRIQPFFEVNDMTIYVCCCMYLSIALLVITCGYAGPDSFVLSMALHVCGQFAALSYKTSYLLKDSGNYHRHITSIVLRHRHLITLAEILENNFNMMFLQETMGTVFLLCLTLYHMITNSEYGDDITVMIFLLYTVCVCCTILAYCYIGECVITESAKLCETFYNSEWYNNPPSHTKLISICMIRAEKPSVLTVGKFCMLSLSTFTSIVKTSMAYSSMLRNFM